MNSLLYDKKKFIASSSGGEAFIMIYVIMILELV